MWFLRRSPIFRQFHSNLAAYARVGRFEDAMKFLDDLLAMEDPDHKVSDPFSKYPDHT